MSNIIYIVVQYINMVLTGRHAYGIATIPRFGIKSIAYNTRIITVKGRLRSERVVNRPVRRRDLHVLANRRPLIMISPGHRVY